MRLKKHYDRATLSRKQPTVTHVDVQHSTKIWKPSKKIVERGVFEGWLELARGTLTIKTGKDVPDVRYKILAPPGTYCCHCGEKVGNQIEARAHVKAEHAGTPSPSAQHPAGYAVHHFYLTEQQADG